VSLTVFLLLATTVTIAAFIQGAVGVGFALICAPVIGLIDPSLLPVSLLILMLPLNVYLAWRERPALDSNGTLWITVGRTVGAVGGVLILSRISPHDLNLFIGASTIAAAIATLCAPTFAPGRNALITAGAVTGITETATGIGGPALAMVFQHYRAPALRSTIALCFAIAQLHRPDQRGPLRFRAAARAARDPRRLYQPACASAAERQAPAYQRDGVRDRVGRGDPVSNLEVDATMAAPLWAGSFHRTSRGDPE
jgi:uncharacterized protein